MDRLTSLLAWAAMLGSALMAGGFFVFSSFVVYTTWALLQAEHYYVAPYLSPFYSPVIFTDPTALGAAPVDHAWFGLRRVETNSSDLPMRPSLVEKKIISRPSKRTVGPASALGLFTSSIAVAGPSERSSRLMRTT